MRNPLALAPITLALGLLLVAACGSSNTSENSCTDTGAICLKTGASCGDTLPYSCPSGGVCCSTIAPSTASSEKIEPAATEPAAR